MLVALTALVGLGPEARAFPQWSVDRTSGNCADCHGNFRANGYVSLKDGTTWGTSLHEGHRGTMLSFDCDTCHGPAGRFPVILNSSVGGTNLDPIACVGCHGRDEDPDPDPARVDVNGAGLRQHHTSAGAAFCGGCHTDNDPNTFTTVPESVLPPYYAPDPAHPDKPTNACNDPPGSEAIFGLSGLDNDGDLDEDVQGNPNGIDNTIDPPGLPGSRPRDADADCGGGVPDIALNPTSLDFGVVTIGGTSTLSAQIENLGDAELTVDSIAPSVGTSTEFSFTAPATSFVIPAGGSQMVTVTYGPVDLGMDIGSLEIASDDPDEPTVALALTGTGEAAPAPDVNLNPMALDFGTVTVGNDSTLPSAIENLGTADLMVLTIDLCVGTSAEFVFASDPPPFAIPPGGSRALSVTYSPVDVGPDTGCIEVASDDPDEPSVQLSLDGVGAAPLVCDIDVDPLTLDYGTVLEGSTSTLSTTVGNTGTADCTVSSLSFSGSADFFLGVGAPSVSFAVAPGETVDVPVVYSPPTAGPDSGTLSIVSDDPDEGSVDVALTGVAEAAPTPDINLDPVALDFGAVTVGASATLSSQVENVGTADLMVVAVDLCTGTSSEFSFAPLASTTIPPGGSETLSVTYLPADLGTDSGCIAIDSNDPDEATVELGLAGSGVAAPEPDVNLDPVALDFGVVTIGNTSTLSAQIENLGDADLTVDSIVPSVGTSAEFSFTAPTTSFVVPAGGSQAVTVTYAPVDVGLDTGSLEIASDDPDEPVVALDLSGSGEEPAVLVPDINLAPMALDFGAVMIGSSASQSTDIQNLGTADLMVLTIDLCVGTSAEFVFASDPPPFAIPPGGSRGLSVTYSPVDLGMDAGCLEIGSDDPDEPVVDLDLTGSGVEVPPVVAVELKAPRAINPENNGVTPIKFLGDMTDLEIAFVECGPASAEPERLNVEDVDGDGVLDVVGLFETRALGLSCGDETLMCTGMLADGTMFEGIFGPIKTVGRACKPSAAQTVAKAQKTAKKK